MKLYDPEMIQVGFRSDLLNVVRLGILDIDHILSSVLKPADEHEVTKWPGSRLRLCLSGFFSRLSRLTAGGMTGLGSARWSDLFVRILGDYSLLPRYLGRTVAAREVGRIGAWIHGPGVACIDDDDNRVTADGGSGGFRLHRRDRIVRVLEIVIRSVIQIGVIVRIAVRVPVKRPDSLLKKDTTIATKETAVLIECEVVSNSGGNEPTAKIATAKPATARGRLRSRGQRQKGAHDEARNQQRHFHTIPLPSASATILLSIAHMASKRSAGD